MVGGTVRIIPSTGDSTQMLSRVFVFTFSGEHHDAKASTGKVFS
jgi:hypothetical protein